MAERFPFVRNRIINNTDYGIYLSGAEPTFGTSLSEWNDIYGNGTGQPGRDLRNGVTTSMPRYVHWGTLDHEQILTRSGTGMTTSILAWFMFFRT